MTTPAQTRLPASERRQAIIEAATRVFVRSSYSGATTADIARAAGVSEPILYRHFDSKRELYLACLQAAWDGFRAALDAKLAARGDTDVVRAVGEGAKEFHASGGVKPVTLWIQALTEAGEDEQIRAALRTQLREVHDYIADTLRQGQAEGVVPPDRVPDAEAWLFVAGALLLSFADRLGGGLLTKQDLAAIATQRHRWLTGAE
jgi:AcrR family transcriptional regulator